MSYAPLLFSQLAELTAMRDIELMEFSLLKTLNGLLLPDGLQILKIDLKNQPCRDILFNNAECIVNIDNIVIPSQLQNAIDDIMNSETRMKTIIIGEKFQIIYHIHRIRAMHVFLVITAKEALSKLNVHLVEGMLQIYRNFCEVLRDSQTDQLTGLYNRKTFDDSINKVFNLIPEEDVEEFQGNKRSRKQSGFWLVMVDIDHFKTVNDKFGHLFGDEVLILLAHLMMSSFRGEDMIFRFGGEEFVFVLRNLDQNGCRQALERFRKIVENRSFPQVGKVTVSLGACRMSRDTYSATLLDYADKAMYHSKKNGRNRLTFFEDLVEAGLEKPEIIEPGDIVLF